MANITYLREPRANRARDHSFTLACTAVQPEGSREVFIRGEMVDPSGACSLILRGGLTRF